MCTKLAVWVLRDHHQASMNKFVQARKYALILSQRGHLDQDKNRRPMNFPIFFLLQALAGVFKNPQIYPEEGDVPRLSSISLLMRVHGGRHPKVQSRLLVASVTQCPSQFNR